MHISIVCIPYQIDVTHWGVALGPQAFLDHGLAQLLEADGHTVSEPVWIELQSRSALATRLQIWVTSRKEHQML